MTAVERERLGSLSSRLTFVISSQRDEIRALKGALNEVAQEYDLLKAENKVLNDMLDGSRRNVIKLKGDLSAKNIEIRRLENEILRLKMIIDEKA